MDWIFFLIIYFVSLNFALRRKAPGPVIIGVPDAENKRMFWLSKPEKTKWDEFKEAAPAFLWGCLVGGVAVSVIIAVAF